MKVRFGQSLRKAPMAIGAFLCFALLGVGCVSTSGPSKEEAYKHYSAGTYYEERGLLPEAIREYRQALRYDPEAAAVWTILAEAYYDHTQYKEAGEAAGQALRRDSLFVEARIVLANSYLARKQVPEAVAEYERTARMAPERWDVLYTLSSLYELRGDFKSAAERLRRILLVRPEALDIKSRMAGLLVKSGALDKAEGAYAEMLQEDTLSLDGHLGLGFVYELKHEFVASVAEYEAALTQRPTSLAIKRRLLNVYQNAGERDRALLLCREVLAQDSTDLAVRATQAILLFNTKRYVEARVAFLALAAKQPKDPTATYYLGRIAYERKDYSEALAQMRAAVAKEPKLGSGWVYLGNLLLRAGDEKGAVQAFQKALGPSPKGSGGLDYLMGYAYAEMDSFIRAVAAYRQSARLEPRDPRTHYGMGVAYDKLGQMDSAVACFQRVIVLDSLDASAYNYIGYLYADRGIHLEESVALVKKALALEPDNGYFIDSMAWAYYKLGRNEEAEREQEKACRIVKDDPVLLDHLGDIYQARGKVKEARLVWQRALDLDPKNEGLKKKLQGGP